MKKHLISIILALTLSGCGAEDPKPFEEAPVNSSEEIAISTSVPDSTPAVEPEFETIPEETPDSDEEESEGEHIFIEEPEVGIEVEIDEPKEEDTVVFTGPLSTEKKSWYFNRNSDNLPPTAQNEIDISKFNAYYLGDTSEKIIYLTFDEGYENGYTGRILDTLKEKNVKAAFFMTGSYIKHSPDLVKRIADEGHLGVNHSLTHPDFTKLTDEEIAYELEETAKLYKEVTGQEMPKYVRQPQGVYSEKVLQKTKELDYKTIFWSFAYKDWEVDNQPSVQEAYNMVVNNHHNGCIMLLHAVSSANTDALPDMIDFLHGEGYRFASLEELK